MNDPKTIIEPLAGYFLDIVAKLRNRPYVPHSYTKLHNLAACRQLTGAKEIIEVGSFKGVTARRLSYIFDHVVTIEIDPALHELARERCTGRSNVELILGDGAKVLPQVAARTRSAVIFLDGHFSGGETGQGDEPEPVLKELDIIAGHLDNFVGIVVDDFRLFGVEAGWPMKHEVLAKLESLLKPPAWSIAILNDQFVAYRRR